ncbi:MAG: protein translocase subunit SecD [Actinomycetota bacterium]
MSARRYKINLVVALLVAFGGLGAVIATDTKPKLGLDLEGGISVILSAAGEGADDEEVLDKTVEIIRQRIDALGVAEPEVARGQDNILIQLPGVENQERALELIGTTAQLTFREVLEQVPREPRGKREAPEITEEKGPEVNREEVVYPSAENPNTLLRLAPAALAGDDVTRAEAVVDATTGANWEVTLDFNSEGAEAWATLTAEQACQRDRGGDDRVAIVLDGEVVTTPVMAREVQCDVGIEGGESVIDVQDEREARDLALVLRYGALPITLEPQEINKVSPTLGSDSLETGLRAGLLGLILVMAYVLVYYRALGLVVWMGLIVFSAVLYTVLSILGETAGLSLSLAGVAGIIVSIGVTADSYIVAFERLKDEIHSGKTLRASVERGMTRAFRTILVADFVTAAAAIILFFLAIGSVRGFALTLGIATLIDVLIAYFFTRSAVQLLSRTQLFSAGRFIGMRAALGVESQ